MRRPCRVPAVLVPAALAGALAVMAAESQPLAVHRQEAPRASGPAGFEHRRPPVASPRSFAALDHPWTPAEDARWSDRFGLPEFDARVTAFAEFRGELIAAGFFTQAAGVPAAHLARWNGERWAPLGDGLPRVEPLALAVLEDRLYAGGIDADGNLDARNLIFCWDGAAWTNVTFNLADGIARSFAVWEGSLVAGGQFSVDQAPGVPHGVVRLESGAWTPVGALAPAAVDAVAARGARLIAAGNFGFSNAETQPVLVEWSGSGWDTLARARGVGLSIPLISSLRWDGADLYAGGWFSEINGVTAGSVARLRAGVWTALQPDAGAAYVTTVMPTLAGLLVGGHFGGIGGTSTYSIARWTGTSWETFGDGLWWGVDAVIEYGGRIIAGGPFTMSGDQQRQVMMVAGWDGAAWVPLRGTASAGAGLIGYPGSPETVRTLEVLDGSLYAGGMFFLPDDPPFWSYTRGVARWDGFGWRPVGPQAFNGTVHALGRFDQQLIAAGSFGLVFQTTGISNVARWTGEEWLPLGSGTNGPVYALAEHQGDLYAGGAFTLAGGLLCSGVARWDGTRWWPVGPPVTTGDAPVIHALEVFGGQLHAAGQFRAIGTDSLANIARWNGASWSALGTGIAARVLDLEIHQGALWAGGDVAPTGGGYAAVSSWDGLSWSHPDDPPDDSVHRLRSAAGGLFAAGPFTRAGGQFMPGVARLEGSGWHPLGRGLATFHTPLPFALAAHDDGLWVGGTFTLAGGRSSFHVARWDLPLGPHRPAVIEPARPNPFAVATRVRFRLPPNAAGQVAVHDLPGRAVRVLRRGPFGSGPLDVTWDGRDDAGELVPAGIYFIRLRSTAGDRTARVAFVP